VKKVFHFLLVCSLILSIPKFSNGQCCAAGNPVSADGSSSQGKGTLKISTLYQHSFSDVYFEGNSVSDFTYKTTFYDFSSIKLAYGITEKFNMAGEIGYFINKSEYIIPSDYTRYARGIGDASLTLRYSLFKNTAKLFEIAPLFTVKIPIGEFDQIQNNVLLPIDLQPSSGSFRYKPSMIIYKGLGQSKFAVYSILSTEFAQAIKTERTINYKYGNLYMVSLFASYQLNDWLKTSLEVREQYRAMANNNGLEIKATGGNVLFLVPRITAVYNDWELGLTYNQPVHKNLNSIGFPQLSNKYAFAISLAKKLNLTNKETPFLLDDIEYKSDSFHVNGICDMCRERIVVTSMKSKDVKWAGWNIDTKMLTIKYLDKPNVDQLMQSLAKIGHDNQSYKATDKKYAKLHSCCKYRDHKNE
jgi:periplasmic mercuric ion binding protein